MKTLKIKTKHDFKSGLQVKPEIHRFSDGEAKRLVSTGQYEYCSKHLWKTQQKEIEKCANQ